MQHRIDKEDRDADLLSSVFLFWWVLNSGAGLLYRVGDRGMTLLERIVKLQDRIEF